MTTDEHPYLNKFRIWPDSTIQYVEGDEPPFSHMSDDFVTIMAAMDLHAFDIFDALNSGGLRKEFERLAYQHYLDRKAAGKIDPPPPLKATARPKRCSGSRKTAATGC